MRDRKYQWLKESDLTTTGWAELKPQSEFYLFVPQNTDLLGEYERGWKITDVISRNAESVTFFYSWESSLDSEVINSSIRDFDAEWQREDITFDISQEFLQQVIKERSRRFQAKQPQIESINPDEFTPGETTTVEITGTNLDQVEDIRVTDDELVKVNIDSKKPESIVGKIEVHPSHPPTELNNFRVTTKTGSYNTSPKKPVSVNQSLEIPE